jgi:DNA-binding NarL/FixJ family response regulator
MKQLTHDIELGREDDGLQQEAIDASWQIGRATMTSREQLVVDLAAKGMTDRQISAYLEVPRETVADDWRSILHKSGAWSRAQVIGVLIQQDVSPFAEMNFRRSLAQEG